MKLLISTTVLVLLVLKYKMKNLAPKNLVVVTLTLVAIVLVYNLTFSEPTKKLLAQVNLGPLIGEGGGSFGNDPELQSRINNDQQALKEEGKNLDQLQKEDAKKCLEQGGLGGIFGGGNGGSILGGGFGGDLGGGFFDTANTTSEAIARLGDMAGLSGQNANTNRQLGQVLQGIESGHTNPSDIFGFLTSAAGGNNDISRITDQLGQITQNGLNGNLDSTQITNLFGNLTNLDGNTLNQLERMLAGSEIAGFQADSATDFFGSLFNLDNASLDQFGAVLNGFEQGEYTVSEVVERIGNTTNLSDLNLNQLGGILEGAINGGGYDISSIADLIGNVSGISGNNLNLLSGAGSIIQGSLNGNFDIGSVTDFIGNLGGLDPSSLGNLASAGDLISSALNGNFDIGETFDFIGGISNLSPDALSLFGGAGNLLSGALEGNFDLGEAFSFVDNLGVLSNDGLLGGLLGNSGVTGIIGGALDGDISFGDAAGLISAIPGLDGLGGILGGLGIGGSVPVKESDGPLLSSTQQIEDNTGEIDKTTKSIEELTVEICTYLKSIQRIQSAYEQRETVEYPDTRRQAASEVEKYRQDLADFTSRGYSYGEDEEGPLFVQNTRSQINGVILPEIETAYFDTLKNLEEDKFAEDTIILLKENTSAGNMPKSTITRDKYEEFISGDINSSDDWWNTFLAINDPTLANKPSTSYLLNTIALDKKKTEAENDFLTEVVAGQGYLPVRECIERGADSDVCLKWQVVTPAIQIKEANADSFSYRQELYTEPNPGDVAQGNEPTVEEVRTFTPAQTGGGGGTSLSQPGGGLGFDISNLINLLTSLRQNSQTGASGNSPYTRPTISFALSLPPLNLVQQGTPDIANIRWQTTGITSCVATNNWLGRGNISETPSIIRPSLSQLGNQGSVDISLPITFEVNLLRERAGQLNTVTGAVNITFNSGQTHQVNIVSMPDDILPGDRFRLALWPRSENTSAIIQIGEFGASKSSMVNTFKQAINAAKSETNPNTTQRNEFNKYDFSYQSGSGTITITPKTIYSIKCQNSNNESLTRQIRISR